MPTRVVTISHTTGAGGETIGRMVADRLGFRNIDEEILTLAAEKEGVDPELVADTERRKGFLSRAGIGHGADHHRHERRRARPREPPRPARAPPSRHFRRRSSGSDIERDLLVALRPRCDAQTDAPTTTCAGWHHPRRGRLTTAVTRRAIETVT